MHSSHDPRNVFSVLVQQCLFLHDLAIYMVENMANEEQMGVNEW